VLKCKGWETDPNAYIYFTIQGHAWEPITKALGKPEWATDPAYMTAEARQDKILTSSLPLRIGSKTRRSTRQWIFCVSSIFLAHQFSQ
jgi:crotonobetainyl-CoA:carnitine CoA-transferase CaiB-like acyl-CoA transferase